MPAAVACGWCGVDTTDATRRVKQHDGPSAPQLQAAVERWWTVQEGWGGVGWGGGPARQG